MLRFKIIISLSQVYIFKSLLKLQTSVSNSQEEDEKCDERIKLNQIVYCNRILT